MALVLEVIPEMRGNLVAVQGHVIDALGGLALIAMIDPEIGELTNDRTHAPDHAPVIEGGTTDLARVPGTDTANYEERLSCSCWSW